MNCDRARDLLDRTDGLELSPRDAEVGADEARALRDHLAACTACTAERAALGRSARHVVTALAGPAFGVSDAELAERVVAALPTGRIVPLWPRLATAAAVLVAAGLFAWQFRPVADGGGPVRVAALPGGAQYPLAPPPVDDYFGPQFVDVTARSGIAKNDHTGRSREKDWMVEVVGHGAAVLDMDGDGDMDLFVPDGNRVDPQAQVSNTWRLYRNDGDLRFTDVTQDSGLESGAWGGGAVAGDLDADGLPDLFVPCFGTNHMFRNLGGGHFADVTVAAGVAGREEEWSTAAALADVDADGDLDLYVSNYADMRRFMVESGVGRGCRWREMSVPCGPQPMTPQRDRLYLNRGDGTFVDATESNTPVLARYSFQAVMTDLDGDGAVDIFVAADGHPNVLLLNDGHGHFGADRSREAGVATDVHGRDQACMGVAVGDVDGDAVPDLFVTNFSHEPNVLYRDRTPAPGQPLFVDVTSGAGLDNPSFFTLGWGAVLLDIDLDGDLDALAANGHLYPGVEESVPSTAYEQHISVFENDGRGHFRDVSAAAGAGTLTRRVHRGLIAADFDDDGDADLFATVLNGRAVLLENTGRNAGGSVRLVLRRAGGCVEAAGARATITTGERSVVRDVVLGSSFGASEDPRLLVGIGRAARADVAVRWPQRAGAPSVVETFPALAAGGTYRIVEGSGRAERVR